MSKHEELIEHLRNSRANELSTSAACEAADALEAQAREIEGLQAELARARASAELIREALQTMREVE